MKKIIYLSALLVVFMLLAGCRQQVQQQTNVQQEMQQQASAKQQAQATPAAAQPEQESSVFTMNMLYNYGLISEFEYEISSSAGGQQNTINMKYRVSLDTANGKAAWLQQSDISVQGSTATTKMWLDKDSLACLKTSTVINAAGQTIQQEGQCPIEGPNSASATAEPTLKYVGTESVTVPAGTFDAKKYELNGMNFWIDDKVPLPLKVSYGGEEAIVMELVSYK